MPHIPHILEPTPTRNEIGPNTKFKTNVGTAVIVILSLVTAVGVTVSFKRDVEEIARNQNEEKEERRTIRAQISVLHENMMRLAYAIDPSSVARMKPLQSPPPTP